MERAASGLGPDCPHPGPLQSWSHAQVSHSQPHTTPSPGQGKLTRPGGSPASALYAGSFYPWTCHMPLHRSGHIWRFPPEIRVSARIEAMMAWIARGSINLDS